MVRNILVVLVLALIFSLAMNSGAQAYYESDEYIEFGSIENLRVIDADKIPYSKGPYNKLKRGVVNGATFWMELPAEVAKVSKEQDPAMGVTVGVVQGVVTSVARAGTALFDIVTFCVPTYEKPVMKPEYALNRADDKIRDLFW